MCVDGREGYFDAARTHYCLTQPKNCYSATVTQTEKLPDLGHCPPAGPSPLHTRRRGERGKGTKLGLAGAIYWPTRVKQKRSHHLSPPLNMFIRQIVPIIKILSQSDLDSITKSTYSNVAVHPQSHTPGGGGPTSQGGGGTSRRGGGAHSAEVVLRAARAGG